MDPPIVDGVTPPAPILTNPPIDERVRRHVKQWLAMSGMSQAVLAQRINKDQAWVSRYLRGEHDADLATVERLAAAFGHNIATLLDVVPDERDAAAVEMLRALDPADRTILARLLERLTRPKRPRRSARSDPR